MWTRSICFAWLLVVASVASAAELASATIQTSGEAEVVLPADAMRLEVEVYCEGSDLREALRLLDGRRKLVKEAVIGLGAQPESVAFDDSQIISDQAPLQPPPQLFLMPADPPETQPTLAESAVVGVVDEVAPIATQTGDPEPISTSSVMVSVLITATFPITGETGDERLIQFNELQDRLEVADLPGRAELERARKHQDAEQPGAVNRPCLCRLGQPRLSVIANLPESEQQKLLQQAFARSRKEAAQLAGAAGATLGALRELKAGTTSWTCTDGNAHSAANAVATNVRLTDPGRELLPSRTNAMNVIHRATIVASYSLQTFPQLAENYQP